MPRNVAGLFPTPVYTIVLPDGAALNAGLQQVIEARRGVEAGVSRSNVGGWQSDIDLLQWGGREARMLADHCIAASERLTATGSGEPAPIAWRPEMWANVNRTGDSNQTHWHPGSYLSFVYYVDDGYGGSIDRADGGELVFVDPRMPFLRMRTPDLRYRDATGDLDEHETWVRPFSGLLIGFPSFLGHSVRPYRGTRTRISIAINMIARRV
jgi:uncharacterized protein (TIGR02466 family)